MWVVLMNKITVSWDNDDKTVIRLDLKGRYGLHEVSDAAEYALLLLDSVPHVVDAIWFYHEDAQLPTDDFLTIFRHLVDVKPPNIGLTVFVGHMQPKLHRMLIELGKKVIPHPAILEPGYTFYYADTLQEARTFLTFKHEHIS